MLRVRFMNDIKISLIRKRTHSLIRPYTAKLHNSYSNSLNSNWSDVSLYASDRSRQCHTDRDGSLYDVNQTRIDLIHFLLKKTNKKHTFIHFRKFKHQLESNRSDSTEKKNQTRSILVTFQKLFCIMPKTDGSP